MSIFVLMIVNHINYKEVITMKSTNTLR